MGLDANLYKYNKDIDESRKLENEYNKKSDEFYESSSKPYSQLSDSEKDALRAKCKKFALGMGLDENGEAIGKEAINTPSALYPEHYFKVGYFRSSYNEAGTNRVLKNLIGRDLYDIFEPGDDYIVRPNWKKALKIVNEMLRDFDKVLEKDCYKVSPIISYGGGVAYGEEHALEVFKKEKEKYDKNAGGGFGNYSSGTGTFFFKDPMTITGVIQGTQFGMPCTYLIYKASKEDLKWYHEALEIVKETIEYVLSQFEIEKYCLHWSA